MPVPGGHPGDWRVPGGSDKAGADNIPVPLCVEPMVLLECCCQTGGSCGYANNHQSGEGRKREI